VATNVVHLPAVKNITTHVQKKSDGQSGSAVWDADINRSDTEIVGSNPAQGMGVCLKYPPVRSISKVLHTILTPLNLVPFGQSNIQ
jgi:hypothetical protein